MNTNKTPLPIQELKSLLHQPTIEDYLKDLQEQLSDKERQQSERNLSESTPTFKFESYTKKSIRAFHTQDQMKLVGVYAPPNGY